MQSFTVRTFLALCSAGSSCLLAQPSFVRQDVPVGASPVSVVAGDFNGDGRPDLATVTFSGVFILLNKGGGNFGQPIRAEAISAPEGAWPDEFVAAGDFNGDGKQDLATSKGVFLSHADGTFQPSFLIEPAGTYRILAAGDFNRDAKTDLVVNSFQQGVSLLLGNGDGTFRSGLAVVGSRPGGAQWALAADFNRDARLDLVTFGAGLEVFLGNGDGTFEDPIQNYPQMVFPDPVDIVPWDAFLASDFNGDGMPDLALGSRIMLSKGNGTFQPPPVNFMGQGNYRIFAAADFTRDGMADLIVGNATSIAILPGKGDGTFAPPLVAQSVGSEPYPPGAVADLDSDGRLDLAVANRDSKSVSILISGSQVSPAPRRGVSSATSLAIVAPGSLATLYAPTTATAGMSASPPWPARLGEISLDVRDSAGVTRQAPLLYVSTTQINFQVPDGTALGEATLSIVDDRGTNVAGSMQVDAVAPGLFLVSAGTPAAYGVRVEADGTQAPIPVYSCTSSAAGVSCDGSPIPLSAASDRPIYLSFFGTGFRGAKPDNVTCSVNGVQVPVVYAGPQGTPGLDQINIRLVPKVLDRLPGEVQFLGEAKPVAIQIDGVSANWAWVAVR